MWPGVSHHHLPWLSSLKLEEKRGSLSEGMFIRRCSVPLENTKSKSNISWLASGSGQSDNSDYRLCRHTGFMCVYCLSSRIPSGHWWGTRDCSEKSFAGTNVREFHPLPTVNVEAHPSCAKSSLIVYQTAGVVPSFASRFRAARSTNPIALHTI